jgi:hypothetical protein
MTDNEIVEEMKKRVESIVREKARQDFNETKTVDKKAVAKAIISELEQVIKDEN